MKERTHFGPTLPIILLSYFLILMDNSIVFSSSLSIGRELAMDPAELSWISSAYALTFGGLLLLGGRLGDLFGRRRIFLAGLCVFTTASLFAGLSTNALMIIMTRAIQGIGSSMLAPSTLAMLVDTYEGDQRRRSIIYYGAVAGIGSSFGMVIGGFIAAYASWRYGFFIDVPIGLVLIALTLRFIAKDAHTSHGTTDVFGAILSSVGFSVLVYAISGREGRALAAIVAAVCLTAFVVAEKRAAAPLMPLALYADAGRLSAYIGRFLMMGASMSYFFLMPTALQQVFGFTPLLSAIGFLPLTITQFVVSTQVTTLSKHMSNASVLILGSVIDALGLLWGSLMGIQSGYLVGVALSMILIGAGQGLIISPLTVAGVAGANSKIAGAASGVINMFHQIGAAVGLAAISSAVAALAPAQSIGRAQQFMLILIVLCGICGALIKRSERAPQATLGIKQ
ncbi:MAG: MFS transporter [Atopobiaceae bacterium]